MKTRHEKVNLLLSLILCLHVTRLEALAVSLGIDRRPSRRAWRFWRRTPATTIEEQAPPTTVLTQPVPEKRQD